MAGDGIGPEVTAQAVRVLKRRWHERQDIEFEFAEALVGGAAIEASGSPLPPRTIDACRDSARRAAGRRRRAAMVGTGARVRPEQGLLDLRRILGLFANLRPVRPLADPARCVAAQGRRCCAASTSWSSAN